MALIDGPRNYFNLIYGHPISITTSIDGPRNHYSLFFVFKRSTSRWPRL
jgi:hypothetical protein